MNPTKVLIKKALDGNLIPLAKEWYYPTSEKHKKALRTALLDLPANKLTSLAEAANTYGGGGRLKV